MNLDAEQQLQCDSAWRPKRLQLRYSLSYVCIFRRTFYGRSYRWPFRCNALPAARLTSLGERLAEGDDFAAYSDLCIEQPLPRLQTTRDYLVYCTNQLPNFYIDLQDSFEEYTTKLSSNTRSSMKRKVRRFAEASRGSIDFRVYRSPSDLHQYYTLARGIASKTYQEKLFAGGIPDNPDFEAELGRLAANDSLRGYLLFLDKHPVAYLHIPIRDGVAEYEFLGYDPAYANHSPGAVLLYLALQSLFGERLHSHFNFGYGANQTKLVMSTNSFLRADVYCFRNTLRIRFALFSHIWITDFSELCGKVLDRLGLRVAIKRWLRLR